MPTVKEVIHQLGYPPNEICDDWMLQLSKFSVCYERGDCPEIVEHADDTSPNQIPSQQSVQPHAAWSLIEVDACGLLSPHEPTLSSRILTKDVLSELTVQLSQWSRSRDFAPNEMSRKEQSKGVANPARPSTAIRYGLPVVFMLAAAWLLSYWIPLGDQLNVKQRATTTVAADAAAEHLPVFTPQSSIANAQVPTEDNSLKAAAAHSLQTLNPVSPSDTSPESLLDQAIHLGPLLHVARSGNSATPGSSSLPSSTANNSPSAYQSPIESSVESSSPTAPITQSAEEPMIDVLGELANMVQSTMAQSAEEEPVEPDVHTLTSNKSGQARTAVDKTPLTLELSPAIQVQTFDKSVRPRQPMWKLRLSVSEEFTVEPSEAQVLEDRSWASWVLREVKQPSSLPWSKRDAQLNSQSPTQIMVQAQLANHRQTSLRWRIMAGASDFPSLAIPLDPTWLDRAQSGLRTQARWLLEESERTQALGRADGLPSATRAALSTRRRALEAQHKLATRWLEIVADAIQFPAWLDGQIDVHAQLHDGGQAAAPEDMDDVTHAPSPPLLQFGTL